MTACVGEGLVRRIFRWGLPMLAVTALALGAASPSHAQTAAKAPAPKAVAAQKPAPAPSRANGLNTAITVHGHWVIDVKNPDGTVVTHREFENGLNTGNGSGGSGLLAELLGRVASIGSWGIELIDSATNNMEVNEPSSVALNNCQADAIGHSTGPNALSCSGNLTVSVPTTNLVAVGTIVLMGSIVVPQNAPVSDSIGFVATYNVSCTASIAATTCIASDSQAPSGLIGDGDPRGTSVAVFTSRNLDGQNTDPAAVPVAGGQTVQVTVTISFSSGS